MITRIREVRRARGMTLDDVARACKPPTTAQTIGRLETGTRTLPDFAFASVDRRMVEMSRRDNKLPIAWIEPEDIANGVVFLASDEGRYVTGTALDITAGTSTQWSACGGA